MLGMLRVADAMSQEVEFTEVEASVKEAAELMGEIEVGAMPVGSREAIQGILTDRDILYRLVAAGRDPGKTTVREIMSSPVVTCRPEDAVQAAMDLMAAHHIRRLPVCDPAGRVIGWITLSDLSRRLLLDSEALQGALRDLTEAPV
jgi:CBS domain-containing protein